MDKTTFTPHARGSTQALRYALAISEVYPACAGIDPPKVSRISFRKCLPRMRGDRPRSTAPGLPVSWFTPHARGSTLNSGHSTSLKFVYPACAGIDLEGVSHRVSIGCLPRMRGDRPQYRRSHSYCSWFTPHARGS